MKRSKFKVDPEKVQKQIDDYNKSKNYSGREYSTFYETPEGMQIFQVKADKKNESGTTYKVDCIPFEVLNNFPDKMWKGGNPPEAGDTWYVIDVHVHKNVGPNNESFICPKHSFRSGIASGDKAGCPWCEEMDRLQNLEPDDRKRKEIYFSMRPQRRLLFNFINRDGGEEEDKGIQLFDVAYNYKFHEGIDDAIEEDEDGVSTWWDIDDGKLLRFKVKHDGEATNEKTGKSYDKIKFTSFKLVKRVDPVTKKSYVISDEELEESVSPQKWLKLFSYDEIKALIPAASAVSENTDDDDDEEEEEVRKPRARREKKEVAEDECPHGYEFGVEFSSHGHETVCDDCEADKYEACLKRSAMLKKKNKGKRNEVVDDPQEDD